MSDPVITPQQRAHGWLQQQGMRADSLTLLSGYTNHVFLVEQADPAYPQRSVLRLADFSLVAGLCPLAYQFDAVLQRHIAAAKLGLSPEVITTDREAGVMWLAYAGERKSLEQEDFTALWEMLAELYSSGLDWEIGGQVDLEKLLRDVFKRKIPAASPLLKRSTFQVEQSGVEARLFAPISQLEALLQQAQQRGYFDYPQVPIHGDLNPGNLLHNGERWWLIDWDFSGMQLREWDLAGLAVEHGWRIEQALVFAPKIARADMKWFCSCFALLSWHWHVQRGSAQRLIRQKAETMQYWITLRG